MDGSGTLNDKLAILWYSVYESVDFDRCNVYVCDSIDVSFAEFRYAHKCLKEIDKMVEGEHCFGNNCDGEDGCICECDNCVAANELFDEDDDEEAAQ